MSRARDLAKLGNINVLSGDDISNEVGIASTVPRSTLDVRGELQVGTAIKAGSAGVLTATSFDGGTSGNVTGAACTFTTGTFNGNVTIGGTLTYEDVTNVDSLGIVTARAGVNISGGQLQVGVAYSVGAAGVATAAGFVGPLTGAVTGNADTATTATTATNVTVTANNSTDETVYPIFVDGATGSQGAESDTGLTYNPSDGNLTSTTFTGNVVGNQSGGSITATTGSYSSNLTVGSGVTIGSAGVSTFSGGSDLHLVNNVNLYLGNEKDAQILHTGTNFNLVNDQGSIFIQNDATANPDGHIYIRAISGENSIHCADDGQVELYYDNDRKFRTVTSGAQVESTTGDANFIVMAEEDDSGADAIITARVTNDSASSYIMFGDSSDANIGKIRYKHDQDEMLFYTNDTEKWRITTAGNLQNNSDSGKLELGVGEDLQLYHDGSNSYVKNATGDLIFQHGNENLLQLKDDSSVHLYFDNAERLKTTNDGTVTTGISTATQGFSFLGSATYGIEARSNSTQSTDTNKALKVRNNSDTDTFSVSYKGEVFVGPYDGGFLGIGTDNPQTQLHITAAGPVITHDATNGSSGLRINSQQYQTSGQLLRVQNAGITTFVIQRNGFTGINTNTVQRGPLHVHNNGTGDCQIHLTNDETGPTGNDGFTVFTGGDAGPDAGFVNRESGGAIEMYTHNGSSIGERLRVGSAGQIGIGGANYGTDGQVLTSGGASAAPSWADAGGVWQLIDKQIIPQNTSNVDVSLGANAGITTAYAAIKVYFDFWLYSDDKVYIKGGEGFSGTVASRLHSSDYWYAGLYNRAGETTVQQGNISGENQNQGLVSGNTSKKQHSGEILIANAGGRLNTLGSSSWPILSYSARGMSGGDNDAVWWSTAGQLKGHDNDILSCFRVYAGVTIQSGAMRTYGLTA